MSEQSRSQYKRLVASGAPEPERRREEPPSVKPSDEQAWMREQVFKLDSALLRVVHNDRLRVIEAAFEAVARHVREETLKEALSIVHSKYSYEGVVRELASRLLLTSHAEPPEERT